MNLLPSVTRQHIVVAATCMAAFMVLVAVPPIDIGGIAVWLYLTPALVAAYCIPLTLLAPAIIVGTALGFLVGGGNAPGFLAESVASSVFLLAVASWRQWGGRFDTLLVATSLLLFVAFPIDALLSYYLGGASFQHAMLSASRYALSSLFALLLAEILVVAVTLSRTPRLGAFRELLNFRPSLVHVVEIVIGTAVVVSFSLTLMMFWRSWDEDLASSMRESADVRFDALYLAAEASTSERLRLSATIAESMFAGDADALSSLTALLDRVGGDSFSLARESLDGALVAVAPESGALRVFPGLELATAERAFALARAQVEQGLVALSLRMPDGEVRPAYILVAGDEHPDILLVHRDLGAAANFTFEAATQHFNSLYPAVNLERVLAANSTRPIDALPKGGDVLEENELGWILWKPADAPTRFSKARVQMQAMDEYTQVRFTPSQSSRERFAPTLHGVALFAINADYWPFFSSFATAVTVSTLAGMAILAALLWFSRLLVSTLVSPLGELTTVFESWRQFRGGELGSGAALQAMDARGFSALNDIHSLQVGFRSLAQDVMYGERRLSTIAANYDELLRSLPLGVLAVDGASRVQFLNDALGEITEQRQDAIARLKAQAAQMLATNTTVDEWQLTLEDRPPKSLLLVVNHRLDDRGQESGLWVIATDLTEQKQTNAQLIQASKLATLGEMSTGMAHELNQPLNVISLATSNLRFSIKKGKATPDNTLSKLDRIDGAVHRAASIIDHMRAYGRLAGEGLSEINVGEVVKGSCNLLSEQLKLANITLVNEVPEQGLMVKGNAIQLEQVLINLINNAKDAIRDRSEPGKITVDSEVTGGRMLLRVTDSGGGIPDHVLPHVFEPFFTTKPVGKGTGLGGSISYGIVREMQGDIWAENVPGGAQITISLPLMRV